MTNAPYLQLSFENFEDLSTRLVLIPMVEDEGRGAVIASYTPCMKCCKVGGDREKTSLSTTRESRDEQEENLDDSSASSKESVENGANAVGCILQGLGMNEGKEWREKEFSEILAGIRTMPSPILLSFDAPSVIDEEQSNDSSSSEDSDDSSLSSVSEDGSQETVEEKQPKSIEDSATIDSLATKSLLDSISPSGALLTGRWSAWGQRMRATAVDAASSAANISSKVVSAATDVTRARLAEETNGVREPQVCGLYIMTGVGAFLPVVPSENDQRALAQGSVRSSTAKVTTASCLLVRLSTLQPCPATGYKFQWFRSKNISASIDSSCWVPLDGATSASFQPSATEVGFFLQCEITIEKDQTLGELSDSDCSSDECDDTTRRHKTVICQTSEVVAVEQSLFNVARQALVRGAHFGGFRGRGNAEGLEFKIHVEIARISEDNPRMSSALTLFQLPESKEPIKLSPQPLQQVSAKSSSCNSKFLDLYLPFGLPDSATRVNDMFTHGTLQLEAPNRLARESLLLSIGIANYQGKPNALDVKTILYPSDDLVATQEGVRVKGDREVLPENDGKANEPNIVNNSNPEVETVDEASSPQEGSPRSELLTKSFENARLENQLAEARRRVDEQNKRIVDLERRLQKSEASLRNSESRLTSTQQELRQAKVDVIQHQKNQRTAENLLQSQLAATKEMKAQHASEASLLNERISSQASRIVEFEKLAKSHANEKAVLTAAVEARESKLSKLAELQESFDVLSSKVSQHDKLRTELNDTNTRYNSLCEHLQMVTKLEKECRVELDQTHKSIEAINARLKQESEKSAASQKQLETLKHTNQKLRSERNSLKSKADSLSKEISAICRNGRTVPDIVKMIGDDEARAEEVAVLRQQKRKAVEECNQYRTALEQHKTVSRLTELDRKSATNMQLLERNVELERLLSELTEYINAKEMQMSTLKEVNDALQQEIRGLAKANMNKNEV